MQDPGVPDVMAANLTLDSREVRPGDRFCRSARIGAGWREFIAPALAQGAVAVLAEPGEQLDSGDARIVPIRNLNLSLALGESSFIPRPPVTSM